VKPFEATELVSTISRIGEFVEPRRDPKSKSESGTKSKLPERAEEMPSPTVKSPKSVMSRAEIIPAMPVETKSPTAPGNMAEFEVIAASPVNAAPISEPATSQIEPEPADTNAEVVTTAAYQSNPELASAVTEPAEQQVAQGGADSEPSATGHPLALAAAASAGSGFNAAPLASPLPEFAVNVPPSSSFVADSPEGTSFALPPVEHQALTIQPVESVPVAESSDSTTVLSAAAPDEVPTIASGPDPALVEDRTQWATEFPTRFGLQHIEETEGSEGPSHDETDDSRPSAEEVDALLASIPGPAVDFQAAGSNSTHGRSEVWPGDTPTPTLGGWQAQEVPVEADEAALILADEMEADAASMIEPELTAERVIQEPEAKPSAQTAVATLPRDEIVAAASDPFLPTRSPNLELENTSFSTLGEFVTRKVEQVTAASDRQLKTAASPAPPVSSSIEEPTNAVSSESVALANATEHAFAAITSELEAAKGDVAHGEVPSPGGVAIEDMVNRVLERLKPKLIAEIAKELSDSKH
jgi:hypothetical protein